jgi:hypothetical protein
MGKKKRYRLEKPKVVTWFVVYCIALSLVSVLLIAGGIMLMRVDPDELAALDKKPLPPMVYLIVGILSLLVYAVAPFLPDKPWKWVYGLVLICITMPGCCYLPLAIPLLVFWVQPGTKEYFRQGH